MVQRLSPRSRIAGIGHHIPERVVSSQDLEEQLALAKRFEVPAGFVERMTGVAERRWASPGTTNSELAALAAEKALAAAGIDAGAVDCVIFAAVGQDLAEPATANILQDRIGARRAQALDVKNACNSWVNGIDVADSLIASGKAECVLVAAGEIASFFVDLDIPDYRTLLRRLSALTLGDAGAAAIIVPTTEERGILATVFHSAGEEWPLATVNGGGTRFGWGTATFESQSSKLLAVAERQLPPLILAASRKVGWKPAEVDLIVPHQVSTAFSRKMCQAMGVSFERCMVTLDRYGNCGAASVPLALSVAAESGRLSAGDKVALVAAAAGFSAGVVALTW
jgi:3-oxoacyl-(acyl-carrier-protein) synthase III